MYKEWNVTIPALTGDEERKAYVYVPDIAYSDDSLRFPVLYMFDGHNLFSDAEASYGKCWGMLKYFTEHDVPLMIAALECNHHAEDEPCGGRMSEYSPFDFKLRRVEIRGRGALTMDYIVHEFKPFIDENYPTLPDREHTFIAGSSMGGLMTLYALAEYGGTFSRGAALSPSLLFSRREVKAMLAAADLAGTVVYTDMGQQEMAWTRVRSAFGDLTSLLIKKDALTVSRVVPGGVHSEASWERQIPFFLNTLLYEPDER